MSIENLTIDELLTVYEEDKRTVAAIEDYNNPSIAEREAMTRVSEARKFFTQTQQSIDYITASAMLNDDSSISCLIDKNTYLSTLLAVTDNANGDLIDTVYSESSYKKTDADREKAENALNDVICGNGIITTDFYAMKDEKPQYTVAEIMNYNNSVKEICYAEQINENQVFDSTREKLTSAKNSGKALEIVESSDGYVMAVSLSPEEFSSNPHLAQQFAELVTANNEVVHNEAPKQTTSDLSRVGGNIKYEEMDDIGTVERESGELSDEEKENKSYENER